MKLGTLALGSLIALGAPLTHGCGDDDTRPVPDAGLPVDGGAASSSLALTFEGLAPLGDGFVYEGWIIVADAPVSTGRFTVDADGAPDPASFLVDPAMAAAAAAFVLTIEPTVGDDPAPSATHILAGAVSGDTAILTTDHMAALGTDFADAAGVYVLNTPTSGAVDDDYGQGIWWMMPATGMAGLTLPTLPDGWEYEGWVVGPDETVTTGRFTAVAGADSDGAGPTAGDDGFPELPGQDFIDPAVVLTSGHMAVISVEPSPDDSPAPFAIKPLVDTEIEDLAPPNTQPMANVVAGMLPSGTATFSPAN